LSKEFFIRGVRVIVIWSELVGTVVGFYCPGYVSYWKRL